jgi:3-oxoacyl-[acyl-carrier protein] reductase
VTYVRGEQEARDVARGIAERGGKAEVLGFDVADMKASEDG